MSACLRQLDLTEVGLGAAYLCGELTQRRMGIGYATLQKAREASAPAAEPSLTLTDVSAAFVQIAAASGAGSAGQRRRLLEQLFARATSDEQTFLMRLVVGELRQGALEGVMLDAVAMASSLPGPLIRRSVMMAGNLFEVARVALTEGQAGLGRFALRVLEPVKPMLAQTATGLTDPLEKWGQAAFEYKLDGARVQVHKEGLDVRVFSRSLNDVTEAVPEIVEHVRTFSPRSLVLDGEVIALKPDGRPHAFQETMSRFGRRLEVDQQRHALPLSGFYFDCLHLDGEDLIDRTTEERFRAFSAQLPEDVRVPRLVTASPDEAEAFLERALSSGHEGVMVKSLEALYEAGNRGSGWLKLKPAHTLDLVVLAAEWGHGRRQGWLSNLHLGARDPVHGGFVMLGKTFKGMTDALLTWQTQKLQELAVTRDEWVVHVRPELVVEIAFDGVLSSSQYPGGVALRFARVKRYRADKRAEEADTIERVKAIHAGNHAYAEHSEG